MASRILNKILCNSTLYLHQISFHKNCDHVAAGQTKINNKFESSTRVNILETVCEVKLTFKAYNMFYFSYFGKDS